MIYLVIFFLSVVDHLLTAYLLSHGSALEFNPIMRPVMEFPFWASFLVKNGWTAGLLVALFLIEKNIPWAAHIVRLGKTVILIAYLLLMAYYLYGFWVLNI